MPDDDAQGNNPAFTASSDPVSQSGNADALARTTHSDPASSGPGPGHALTTEGRSNNNGDFSAPAPAAAIPARKYRLSATWLSLTFYVLAYPAGRIVFNLVNWIKSHNTGESLLEAWNNGILIVEEGFPTADSNLGVLALNICTTIIMITPVLLLLYAYRVLYVDFQTDGENNLTPPENGLITESIRVAGLGWLANVLKFLFGKPRGSNPALFVLKEAFTVCLLGNAFPILFLLMWVLINASRIEIPSTAELREVPIATPLNYSITQSVCHPYDMSDYVADRRGFPDINWLDFNKPCGISAFSPDFVPFDKVERLASNMSTALDITTLADASDLAALVVRNINVTTKFQMQTFGARAVCRPDERFYTSEHERFVTIRRGKGSQDLHWPQRVSSRACVGDPNSCPSATVEELRNEPWRSLQYPFTTSGPGPFELGLKFRWPLYASDSAQGSDGLWTAVQVICHVSYYNITLEYVDGRFALVSEILSERFLSDGFSRHLRFGMIGGFLDDEVLPAFFSPSNNDEGRLAFLNQEVARLAIASASAFTGETGPTFRQSKVTKRVLAQYPMRAIAIFLVLSVLYSLFAFVVCLAFSLARASDPVLVTGTSSQTSENTPISVTSNTNSIHTSVTEESSSGKGTTKNETTPADTNASSAMPDLHYRVSIRRFLTPIFTAMAALWLTVQTMTWALPPNADVNAYQTSGNITTMASLLFLAATITAPIVLYFYGRRVFELYLYAQGTELQSAPKSGILVESFRAIGISSLAAMVKEMVNPRNRNGPRGSILKEVLVIFLCNFSTLLLLAFSALVISSRYGTQAIQSPLGPSAEYSTPAGDSVTEDTQRTAYPFLPTFITITVAFVHVLQLLLICLAQSLIPVS